MSEGIKLLAEEIMQQIHEGVEQRDSTCNLQNVSCSACPHCDGTGKMQQDYYDDDDMNKIITVDETCLVCDGSGIDS